MAPLRWIRVNSGRLLRNGAPDLFHYFEHCRGTAPICNRPAHRNGQGAWYLKCRALPDKQFCPWILPQSRGRSRGFAARSLPDSCPRLSITLAWPFLSPSLGACVGIFPQRGDPSGSRGANRSCPQPLPTCAPASLAAHCRLISGWLRRVCPHRQRRSPFAIPLIELLQRRLWIAMLFVHASANGNAADLTAVRRLAAA